MAGLRKAAVLVVGLAGCRSAVSGGPAPTPAPAVVTVRQVLTTQALAGEMVVVTGRCLGKDAPTLAKGSRPLSARVWQIEDNGVAAWVVGPAPAGCSGGTTKIAAQVAQDTLPRWSAPRTVRQYLVVR